MTIMHRLCFLSAAVFLGFVTIAEGEAVGLAASETIQAEPGTPLQPGYVLKTDKKGSPSSVFTHCQDKPNPSQCVKDGQATVCGLSASTKMTREVLDCLIKEKELFNRDATSCVRKQIETSEHVKASSHPDWKDGYYTINSETNFPWTIYFEPESLSVTIRSHTPFEFFFQVRFLYWHHPYDDLDVEIGFEGLRFHSDSKVVLINGEPYTIKKRTQRFSDFSARNPDAVKALVNANSVAFSYYQDYETGTMKTATVNMTGFREIYQTVEQAYYSCGFRLGL